jgi:hypothetical protein
MRPQYRDCSEDCDVDRTIKLLDNLYLLCKHATTLSQLSLKSHLTI